MSDLEKIKQYIINIHDVQVNDPMSRTDEYMRGLANGLIMAKAVVCGESEPDFIPASSNLLSDPANGMLKLVNPDITAFGSPPADVHMGSLQINDNGHVAAFSGEKPLPADFYHMNGQPAAPDIEEDLGQLLLACQRAIDFLVRGPILGASQKVIEELYEQRVEQLIPRLQSVIENRIVTKHPYSQLIDLSFIARNQLKVANLSSFSEMNKAVCSAQRLAETGDDLTNLLASYDPLIRTGWATEVLQALAIITEHEYQIMNMFGWTMDDVKLISRQRIDKLMNPTPTEQ